MQIPTQTVRTVPGEKKKTRRVFEHRLLSGSHSRRRRSRLYGSSHPRPTGQNQDQRPVKGDQDHRKVKKLGEKPHLFYISVNHFVHHHSFRPKTVDEKSMNQNRVIGSMEPGIIKKIRIRNEIDVRSSPTGIPPDQNTVLVPNKRLQIRMRLNELRNPNFCGPIFFPVGSDRNESPTTVSGREPMKPKWRSPPPIALSRTV